MGAKVLPTVLAARCIAACFAVCALVPPLKAQANPELASGSRVRVVTPGGFGEPDRYVSGTLVRFEGDSAVLALGSSGKYTAVYQFGPGSRLRLERFVNRRSHVWEGVVLGTLLGAATGSIIASAAEGSCSEWCFGQVIGLGVGAPSGALIGGIVGSMSRSDAWVRVRTTGLRITIGPTAVGFQLAF